MDPLEALGLLEADPARLGGSDEAHRANKKYAPLVDPFPLYALQFVRQGFRSGIARKGGKGGRAYRRAVVKLDDVRRSGGADLADPLQIDDPIDECGVGPGLGDAVGLLERAAPGGPVRMNRFIQNRSISPPSGSFRNFRKRYANLP
jgi:hypothetical protein